MSGHSAIGGNADAPNTAPRFDLSDDTLRHVGASFVLAYRELEAENVRLREAIEKQLREREWHHSLCGGEAGCVCNQGWRLTRALKGADSGDRQETP